VLKKKGGRMSKIFISRDVYLDKMKGCWLGKNIGGTLGAPFEGKKYVQALSYFDWNETKKWLKNMEESFKQYFPEVKFSIDSDSWSPGQPLPNDDLDFQLVWLKMLEDRGVNPTFNDFVDYWMRHLHKHWYAEYSFCTYNIKRGLKPPISGAFQNYFVDEMGSPIRSEIWACVAPGDPQLAASLAWMDSSMDHTGGEGGWGEMFWAAVESAAFVINDAKTLIEIGLSMIPISSHIARCIKEAVRCYEDGISWGEARERIATLFGHHNACNAIPNHGFTIIGWLYGKDFGDKLCKAVNCGYDTDCTGATLGALLGILYGASNIPEEWKKPVGDAITPVPLTITEGLPLTITDLTSRTQQVAEKLISERSQTTIFAEETSIPDNILSLLFDNERVRPLLTFDPHCSVEQSDDLQVVFHYGGEPVLYPNIRRTYEISLMKDWKPVDVTTAKIEIKAPDSWEVKSLVIDANHYKFSILTDTVEKQNILEVILETVKGRRQLRFTILGPEAIRSIPASTSAPREDL